MIGLIRSTFALGADGRILKEWRKVKAAGHAAQVLEWCRGQASDAR